jgi:signal peptidase II
MKSRRRVDESKYRAPDASPMPRGHAMRKYNILIALAVVLFDRGSKWLIEQNIALHDSIVVIPGLFRLTHVENRGAAFGLFDDSPHEWKITALILFSLAALVVVTALLWKNGKALNPTGIGLSLVMGGAVGNLWDRLAARHVVDFLDFYIGTYHWPAFNVADSAIVVGALLLVADILFDKSAREAKAAVEN